MTVTTEWAARVRAAYKALGNLLDYVPTVLEGRDPEEEEAANIEMFRTCRWELEEILIWADEAAADEAASPREEPPKGAPPRGPKTREG